MTDDSIRHGPRPADKPASGKPEPLRLVILGLSISSAWGNGHATTFRSLVKALGARGHQILFLERDVPWYASHRDCLAPEGCRLEFYRDLADLERFAGALRAADAVIVGSYVPEGVAVIDWARQASSCLAFYDIDTPVTLAKLEAGDEEYLAARQIPALDLYLSFTGGPTLERLEQQFGARAARALHCSADPDLYRPRHELFSWDLSYLGTWSADRQPMLERLLLEPARRTPALRFAVAGAQYPAEIDWPANVERFEHVPPHEHPRFYARSRFTLNLTREDMRRAGYSPSIRLFEAGACGTPIISDSWDGLDSLFTPEQEILVAESGDEVLAALKLERAARNAIGDAGRRRVLGAHTAEHRAVELEHELRAARTRSRRPRPAPMHLTLRHSADRPHVLVAGGAGFLGSHLCDRLLAEGAEVTCVDNLMTGSLENLTSAMARRGFTFVEADIIEPLPAVVADTRFDRIYNLACPASPPLYQADPTHTLLTSVVGTRNLLALAERCGARLLLSSTSEIYGDPDQHPQPESYNGNVNCTGPRACYDEGKRCAETLCFDHDRAGRVEVRVARIFNSYGPRLSAGDGRVVSSFIAQALAGEDLTVFGTGNQTRAFCFADDMVAALMALMAHEGEQPGPVNLGTRAEITVMELARTVIARTGSRSTIQHLPLPMDDPRRRRPDIAKAERLLGWQPCTPLEKGLDATIQWFRGRLDSRDIRLAGG